MNRETARREIDNIDFYLQNHTDDYSESSHTAMMMAIDALSLIPDNATNGEVIKALFQGREIDDDNGIIGLEIMLDDRHSFCSWFDDLWWNAPYKAESEDKK